MNSKIFVYCLGAGQDVGRSCILVQIGDKRILLDCGLHMGHNDQKKFPDFPKLQKKYGNRPMNEVVDLCLISHFHLDHIGALPYLTEVMKYTNPIVMTTPTKALLPYMLEDYSKVVIETNKDSEDKKNYLAYTDEQIKSCVERITTINLHENMEIGGIKIKSYYAGHILGACMFLIEYNGLKVVYTGDFNSNADRHLGAAWIDKCRPNVLITESTYATTVRDSKKSRERDFLKEVQETTEEGGKVLIPVFALGRAQELCVLVETIWKRMNNRIPVYFSSGLIEKVQFFYKLFVNWTNQSIKSSFLINNMFDFKHIQPFNRNLIKSPDPMILFATPGMLHGGTSLQVFTEWCSEEKNCIIIPGYCVAGTLGNKLLKGIKK